MKENTAYARVQITIEVDSEGAWGGDCTVQQIQKQAVDSVIGMLRGAFVVNGLVRDQHSKPTREARLVGVPKVEVIVVQEKT